MTVKNFIVCALAWTMQADHSSKELYFLSWNERMQVSGFASKELYCLCTLIEDDPLDVARSLTLGKATYSKMIQNLFWATGYNVVAIPLAAGIAYPLGFLLSPAVGALFMSLSTVIVSINAMTLRRVRLA